jgi:ATP/maltotriose-dependent transcriptional regulator MalT
VNGDERVMAILRLLDARTELNSESQFIEFWTSARSAIDEYLMQHRQEHTTIANINLQSTAASDGNNNLSAHTARPPQLGSTVAAEQAGSGGVTADVSATEDQPILRGALDSMEAVSQDLPMKRHAKDCRMPAVQAVAALPRFPA